MTIETGNTYILGRKNVTEFIQGNTDLWEIRSTLSRVRIPPIIRTPESSEIRSWLQNNVEFANYVYYEVFCEITVFFVNEQDAIHFKLRWVDGN